MDKKGNFEWSDVTISQYKKIEHISSMKLDDVDKAIELLAVMTCEEADKYYDMPVNQVIEETKKIAFMSKPPKKRFKEKFIIKGITYVLSLNMSKMTFGQYLDYTNILRDNPSDVAGLLSTVLVPKGKKYGEDYDVDELITTLENEFKWIDALGVSLFFSKVYESCIKVTVTYSIRKMKKLLKKEKDLEKQKEIEKNIKELSIIKDGFGKLLLEK